MPHPLQTRRTTLASQVPTGYARCQPSSWPGYLSGALLEVVGVQGEGGLIGRVKSGKGSITYFASLSAVFAEPLIGVIAGVLLSRAAASTVTTTTPLPVVLGVIPMVMGTGLE